MREGVTVTNHRKGDGEPASGFTALDFYAAVVGMNHCFDDASPSPLPG